MGLFYLLVGFALILTVRANERDSMNIHIQQPNAQMYHQQSARNDQFNYGYHVDTVSNQFQHKTKGPDDVTYGCYGYIDPSNRKHLVYYVADRMGYRIIFPNRPTKIFTERVTDSLNKLDGSLKGKDYDEKVVAWNDLYLPDSCFRLGDILSTSASTVHQSVAPPERIHSTTARIEPVYTQPELPKPTQYTIPPHPSRVHHTTHTGSSHIEYQPSGGRYTGTTYPGTQTNHLNLGRHIDNHEANNNRGDEQLQQTVTNWSGSLPDINPAQINLDQFNIHSGNVASSGAATNTHYSTEQQQYSLNITHLLAQIEAVNSQVITLNMLLTGLVNNPAAFSSANEGSCKTVVQLLRSQKTTPQFVFVPILIPFVEGQLNVNQPFSAQAERYQQPKPCNQCKG
ncbi:uncharacterized protein LOC129767759 [Toxorhynchites rutilus septentrionalis]|uniref:uncharacterized protein LOC129767759 n=1 Tax=Toxorhynchites rutilus septentrionalis TaxID=329112 RepID=UPI002479DAF4|nr:uncharacterized protein LOC129767759 [Toxorhynchites rutilus septentrionalis]